MLVKCHECGHSVSQYADWCPSCGVFAPYRKPSFVPSRGTTIALRIVLVLLLLVGPLSWSSSRHRNYDRNQIDTVVTRAMFAHAPRASRIPVRLWSGPRILRIESAFVQYQPRPVGALSGGGPT